MFESENDSIQLSNRIIRTNDIARTKMKFPRGRCLLFFAGCSTEGELKRNVYGLLSRQISQSYTRYNPGSNTVRGAENPQSFGKTANPSREISSDVSIGNTSLFSPLPFVRTDVLAGMPHFPDFNSSFFVVVVVVGRRWYCAGCRRTMATRSPIDKPIRGLKRASPFFQKFSLSNPCERMAGGITGRNPRANSCRIVLPFLFLHQRNFHVFYGRSIELIDCVAAKRSKTSLAHLSLS